MEGLRSPSGASVGAGPAAGTDKAGALDTGCDWGAAAAALTDGGAAVPRETEAGGAAEGGGGPVLAA